MSNESWERRPQTRRRQGVRMSSELAGLDSLGAAGSSTVVGGSEYNPKVVDGAVSRRVSLAAEAIDRCLAVT